jgi:hypothetical protein
MKVEKLDVGEPEKAMGKFQSLLRKLVGVPKAEVQHKRKCAKARYKRKRKT